MTVLLDETVPHPLNDGQISMNMGFDILHVCRSCGPLHVALGSDLDVGYGILICKCKSYAQRTHKAVEDSY